MFRICTGCYHFCFQGGIRTNTTVCLGKIACYLHPQVSIAITLFDLKTAMFVYEFSAILQRFGVTDLVLSAIFNRCIDINTVRFHNLLESLGHILDLLFTKSCAEIIH